MYVKFKSYPLKSDGETMAFVLIRIHALKTTLKAEITMHDGRKFEFKNQWASEEQFDAMVMQFVKENMYI
jgi:hypothetical protein